MQQAEAKRLFEKLKIKTLLDLSLLLPTSYIDKRESSSLEIGKTVNTKAIIQRVDNQNSKLIIYLYLSKFNQSLQAIFFRPTKYHYSQLVPQKEIILHGKLGIFNNTLQLSQPKILKSFGTIEPKYKYSIKESEIKALIKEYITPQNLIQEGLNGSEAKLLHAIHFPSSYKVKDIPNLKHPKVVNLLKFVEAFNHFKKYKGKRQEYMALNALDGDIEPFVKSLPFQLTTDQKKAIDIIKSDLLQSKKAARRLIIGDVGSGKTIVILASAVMAKEYKSLLMVPTSILALQIYNEALKLLPKDIKVALVTQNKNEGDIQKAHFIIGTHALLYKENLPSASLVMVDEQHRFGTKQRAMLEELVSKGQKRPHFLQFSATPIPRTQAMIESALIDVTLIEHTPFEKNITSKVVSKDDFGMLLAHIEDEIKQNHQILIVYPLVEESLEVPYQSIEEARGFWESRYENVFVTHGKDRNKQKVLEEFRDKGKILLATTVIEVGISLPLLTTIVIVGAERLGLASLHQLRGRVGRNGLKSYCYLYTHNPNNQRLIEFCNTTNGFDIAKLDLAYRDSGDILDGTVQSGQKFKWLNLAEDEEIVKIAKQRLDSGANSDNRF